MNSALVRKDPVMLHDPLRTHSRATAVGVILGAIGLLGFLVFGILKPAQNPPEDGIVIGKDSGQVYVKTADPEMLIPTFNLASARLILMGQQAGASEGGEQAPAAEVVAPVIVPDERLEGIPRGRMQGIPGADMQMPTKDQQVSDNWAVCHHLPMNESLNEDVRLQQAVDRQETAVLAGVPTLGKALKSSEAILVELRNGELQLIYRPKEDANRKASMVRAQVPNDDSVMEALDIANAKRRPMSLGLLNSLQEVEPLNPPIPDGAGNPTGFDLGDRTANVGDVFQVELPGQIKYFVILNEGKQEVTKAVATMILHKRSAETKIPNVRAERLREIKDAGDQFKMPIENYPEQIPTVLDPIVYPTTCLGWTLTDDNERTTLYTGTKIPYPKGKDGKDPRPIKVGKANEDKIVLDYFYMPPGRAAVIHSSTSKASFSSGVIQMISDRGLRYGIPDKKTAAGLGLPVARPAPESIITLLPTGVSLNVQDAARTWDAPQMAPDSGDYNGQDTAEEEAPS